MKHISSSFSKHVKAIARKAPDFGLDDSVPKYWFDGNPFKTRMVDALSLIFPEGERYFIESVRAYKDEIVDPLLQQEVKDFTFQEAQHSIAHGLHNDRLRAQGIAVDYIEANAAKRLKTMLDKFPRAINVANTAGAEHVTAIFAHAMARTGFIRSADKRMRALLYWHGMEEIEHKDVAFDVMHKVAKVGYITRSIGMVSQTMTFLTATPPIMNHMLKVDGFTFKQRAELTVKNLPWLFGTKGMFAKVLPSYLAYFKPNFHPSKEGDMTAYNTWVETYNRTQDPIAAADAVDALFIHA